MAAGRGEEHSHCSPSRRRLAEEMAQSWPSSPAGAPHWLHPPGSQGHGSLLDAIHRSQPPATQGVIKKSGEWMWKGKGDSPRPGTHSLIPTKGHMG